MRILQLIPIMAISLAVSGCQYDENREGIYKENGNTLNVTDTNELNNGNDNKESFGYVRHQKSPTAGTEKTILTTPAINREKTADIISRLAVQLPNVNDAATLVTDEEVMVVYDADSNDRFETADQVKRTAASVVPRYFHIYVSDNPNLINEIETYSTLDGDSANIDRNIDQIIQRMRKSPQGRKLSNSENENGEEYGERNTMPNQKNR